MGRTIRQKISYAKASHRKVAKLLLKEFRGHPLLKIRRHEDHIVLTLALSDHVNLVRIEIVHHDKFIVDSAINGKSGLTSLERALEFAREAGLFPNPTPLKNRIEKNNIRKSMHGYFYCNEFMYDPNDKRLYAKGDPVRWPGYRRCYDYDSFDKIAF